MPPLRGHGSANVCHADSVGAQLLTMQHGVLTGRQVGESVRGDQPGAGVRRHSPPAQDHRCHGGDIARPFRLPEGPFGELWISSKPVETEVVHVS
jgi:hypothetical protein